jgi:hypothetical protein
LGQTPPKNTPSAGSFKLFHETSSFCFRVTLSIQNFALGSHVSVGWSKLSHNIEDAFDLSLKTKFPSSPSTASVEQGNVKFVNQKWDVSVEWSKLSQNIKDAFDQSLKIKLPSSPNTA